MATDHEDNCGHAGRDFSYYGRVAEPRNGVTADAATYEKGLLASPGKNVLTTSEEIRSHTAFVVTLTEERALAQAKNADAEIAAGKYRGPQHGIPWGAKDLLATKGYRTT